MKNAVLIFAALIGLSSSAMADGFRCYGYGLQVQVFNKVDPTEGTRTPSTMIISSTDSDRGNRTISKFTYDNGTLESAHETGGLVYLGNVDLRFNDTGADDALILGSRIADTESVRLNVLFNYGDNLADGEITKGVFSVFSRQRGANAILMDCKRHLKN
jgi:hypothetical protein